MKTIWLMILFASILMSCAVAASGQGAGSGCSGGKRVDGYFYTDCWTDTGDDTTRLQSAITAASESTLIFNESDYRVSAHLDLPQKITLEGMAPGEGGVTISKITLTVSNDSIFRIGIGLKGISIKKLGLATTSATNTYGIEALGTTGSFSSQMFHFSNLWIAGFSKGIYVHTTDSTKGWQFDDVHIEDTVFEGCSYGIYLDTINSGWQMNNLMFASGTNQNGIHIEYGGYINMNLIVGNGTRGHGGVPSAGEFIWINGQHGPITMQNINGEAYKKTLIVDGTDSYKTFPIIISNSDLQECHWQDGLVTKPSVVFKNTTVVSQANSYSCPGTQARPSVEGWAEVYSTGDKFCYDASADCYDTSNPFDDSLRSGWAINSPIALVRTDSIGDYNDYTKAFVDITSTYMSIDPPHKPLLSLTNSLYTSGIWYKYRYTYARNAITGRLEMDGDLNGSHVHSPSSPSVGYYFKNGPVQLHGVTASDLSGGSYNWSSGDKGSMLYCSNCTAGTNPCSTSGGGGGALAIRIESGNWACK